MGDDDVAWAGTGGADLVIPCPTCWLLADLVVPGPDEIFHRSLCVRGHENTLVPAVLEHLRSLLGPAFSQSA